VRLRTAVKRLKIWFLGFSVMRVSALQDAPLELTL
jgi:hypothetical protein